MPLTSRTPARRARCIPSGRRPRRQRDVHLVVAGQSPRRAHAGLCLQSNPDSIDHSCRYTRIFSYQVAKRSPLRARRLNVNMGHEYAALVRVDVCFYHRFV